MKLKKLKLSAVFLLMISIAQAQETVPTSGGNASGSGGTVSYTIGQVGYTSLNGTDGTVTQGVQQPFEISVVSGIDQVNGINLECSAYPNPTIDYITLKVENYTFEKGTYQLLDLNGKVLKTELITANETTISMADFVPAVYFLKITDQQEVVKTFKIFKK